MTVNKKLNVMLESSNRQQGKPTDARLRPARKRQQSSPQRRTSAAPGMVVEEALRPKLVRIVAEHGFISVEGRDGDDYVLPGLDGELDCSLAVAQLDRYREG